MLELLQTARLPPGWKDQDVLCNDLETLAEAKRKCAELRELLTEREQAIGSIVKQLKPSRAAHLEQEVSSRSARAAVSGAGNSKKVF